MRGGYTSTGFFDRQVDGLHIRARAREVGVVGTLRDMMMMVERSKGEEEELEKKNEIKIKRTRNIHFEIDVNK